ncbi:MAG: DUF3793 family protein [Eggerthellaceae bacterium]|nr:DUF3793 family protein [Eggerthellaceae bacterium]
MGGENTNAKLAKKIVHNCAPTLAALKPANLFTVHFMDARSGNACAQERASRIVREGFATALRSAREQLGSGGVSVRVLAVRPGNALVLVFRPELVARAFANSRASAYLRSLGYDVNSLDACIAELARRVRASDALAGADRSRAFPHEVGFFLGYPPEDVIAFIEGGSECLCTGCWKAYGDACSAQACFEAYRRCVRMMDRLHEQGAPLRYLAQLEAAS